MVECPPDPFVGGAVVALFALVPVWLVVALLWRLVEPVALPRLVAAGRRVERVLLALLDAGDAVAAAARAVRRSLVERSAFLFALDCRRRALGERYSGLTTYEEWVAEIESVPSAAARRVLLREVERYRPSARLVGRARSLAGKFCSVVRAREIAGV